jgi:hypothetical protein
MKLGGETSVSWGNILFSLEGKPYDGWGPASTPAALGQVRTCEQNCYLSNGGDCCESQGMCERGSCVPGSVCDPEQGCISMTRPEYEIEYQADCVQNPDGCGDWSEEQCPTGLMAQARQCPKEYYWICRTNTNTNESKCKAFNKTYQNYTSYCLLGTCYDSKAECQACSDCPCKSSSSSSLCGSTVCTGCEFCCEDKCVGCDSIERFSGACYQTGADSSCPYPLGQKDGETPNSCGCHYSGLIGDGAARGCAECEFCVFSAAAQGGICLPCDKDPYTGEPYDPNTDDYKSQQWQCSEQCMKMPSSSSSSKICVYTFTANYDDQTQSWSLDSQSPTGPQCLPQPLSFSVGSWTGIRSAEGCKTKTFKMTTSNCTATGDCVAPSPSEYPEPPTGPAECGPWYSCDYTWDAATQNTTYECKQQTSYSSDYYASSEECEAAKESGSCTPPTFNCQISGTTGQLECRDVGFNSGDYKTYEECTQSLTNADCGYKFSCEPDAKAESGYKCVPDSNGDFTSKYACEQNLGSCGKYKCDSGWGCKQDPYGSFASEEECLKNCCTPKPGEELSPTARGSCEYYQADGFSPLTPDQVICESGLTKSQCDAKPTVTTLAGSWSPTWSCGGDCYASVNESCPECPSGNYKIVRSYPAGTPVCTCLG